MTINATGATSTRTGASAEANGTVVIDRVTKLYAGAPAVDDLSLDIHAGEFLSLLGPSGCGKTTTLRMIAGFEHPDAGDIRISGRSVLGLPPYKRNVNTVFQAYALFPHMSVAENVAYGLQQKRVAKAEIRQRVSEALDMVQMRGFADRKATMLSGGQQQRVALARALVNRPAVLLLDEPLAALDRKLREEMQVELKLLQAHLGITFVFVTHDQGEALSMSDRIAIMRAGRIEQLADADTIYARPVSAYVAAFVGQQNFLHGRVAEGGAAVTSTHAHVRATQATLSGHTDGQAAVRPEFIRIERDAAPGAAPEPNTLRGTLAGISHLGDSMQYVVRTSTDGSILVRRPTAEAPDISVDEPVLCSWRAEHVLLFPAEAAAAESVAAAEPA